MAKKSQFSKRSEAYKSDNPIDVQGSADLFSEIKPDQIVPSYEIYDRGLAFLEECLGIIIIEDVFKKTGHEVLKVDKPRNIKGINYPENFKITRKVTKADFKEIQASLIDLLHNGATSEYFSNKVKPPAGIDHATMITDLLCLLLPGQDEKGLLNLLKFNDQFADTDFDGSKTTFEMGIEVDPKDYLEHEESKWPKSHVPRKEWFDPILYDLKLEDVFTLHSGAELEMFALTLGRMLVGCKNNIQSQSRKRINHTWRTIVVNLGRYAGMGKSTLMDYIIDAIRVTGYNTSNFESIGKQFGLASIVESHLSYCPDFNEASLKAFISAPLFKPLITNEKVRVDEKFIRATECNAKSVFMANINKFNASVLYSADDGAISRLAILETRSPQELIDFQNGLTPDMISYGSPDLSPFKHIPWLVDKLQVSENAIMLWMMRICADKFMNHIKNDTLIEYSKDIKRELQVNLPENYDRTLCELLQLSYLLRTNNKYIPELNGTLLGVCIQATNYIINDPRAHEVRNMIKEDWLQNKKMNDHPWVSLKNLDVFGIASAAINFEAQIGVLEKDLGKCLKSLFGELSLASGFKVSPNLVSTKDAWSESRRTLKRTLTLAEKIIDANVDETLHDDGSKERETRYEHIYSANYDRERLAKERNGVWNAT